jgi:hypothetical protein
MRTQSGTGLLQEKAEGKDLNPSESDLPLSSHCSDMVNFSRDNGEPYLEFPRETLPTLLAGSK